MLSRPRLVSTDRRRPQLGRLLVRLLTDAGLQRIGPGDRRAPPVQDQVKMIWSVARTIEVDDGVTLAGLFCTNHARVAELVEKIAAVSPDRFPHTRPHGLLLLRIRGVVQHDLVPFAGPALPVFGRIAIAGESAGDAEDLATTMSVRSPYLALCLLARPSMIEPVQILKAYVHPCASADRLMLVDSDLERQTLAQLLSVQARLSRERGVSMTIDKPLDDIGPPERPGDAAQPPLIPDFLVAARGHQGGDIRRVIVETMGYADAGYRARKARLHPLMSAATGGASVVEHDFHQPVHWPQDWRDNRFRREIGRQLGLAPLSAGQREHAAEARHA